MSDEVVSALLVRLDSARADLRAVHGGLTIAREYDIWEHDVWDKPTRLVGNLLEVVGGMVVALWTPERVEVFATLEVFAAVYPERRLVLRQSGDSAALRVVLLSETRTHAGLSQQHLEIIRLLVDGKNNKEIAWAMGLGLPTIKNHLTRIYKKVGVIDRTQLALKALDMCLLPTD